MMLKQKFEAKRLELERAKQERIKKKQWKLLVKEFEQNPTELMNLVPTPRLLSRKKQNQFDTNTFIPPKQNIYERKYSYGDMKPFMSSSKTHKTLRSVDYSGIVQ